MLWGERGLFNVENTNWDILWKDYYIYKKDMGAYLNLLVNRPTLHVIFIKQNVIRRLNTNMIDMESYMM